MRSLKAYQFQYTPVSFVLLAIIPIYVYIGYSHLLINMV